ncbi:Transposon Tf2-8 polyprotein [Vitis vinifera]|uniref:Transposon Tf2-8 polyprotein n=1 Tax=Vitis vinifera TaxID=29760 RepID=A0A438FQH4_VITVI|nr:Transposon Tf2-8 polyprotein [Vitis vinifera]
MEEVKRGSKPDFVLSDDGILRYGTRLCVPNDGDLRRELLEKAHCSKFAIHPGGTKIYRDLKQNYWWLGMKRDIARFVAQCLVCQQLKAKHQRPAGPLQPLFILEWKWEHITMDFVTRKFLKCEVSLERLFKSGISLKDCKGCLEPKSKRVDWNHNPIELLEGLLTVEKVSLIKERLKATRSRQKSYADNYRRDLEFEVGDHVFLKVSPMKAIMRFGRKGKLSLHFVGPFELEPIQISKDLTYEEVLVQIVDVMDKNFREHKVGVRIQGLKTDLYRCTKRAAKSLRSKRLISQRCEVGFQLAVFGFQRVGHKYWETSGGIPQHCAKWLRIISQQKGDFAAVQNSSFSLE